MTADGKPWNGKKKGEVVEVRLKEVNHKGKWRCEVVGYAGTQGTLGGSPPADAREGQKHHALVVVGNDPKNLELEWPS